MIVIFSIVWTITVLVAVLYRRAYRRVLYLSYKKYTNSTSDCGGTWYAPDLPPYGIYMLTQSAAYKRERSGLGGSNFQRADGPGTWMDDEEYEKYYLTTRPDPC